MTDQVPTPTCPDCGTHLPEDSPRKLCPSCLMRQALASRTVLEPGPEPPSTPPPSPEEMADKFPQFEITECLGRGGMGVVYKARQKSLNRWVAIKILAPELVGEERFAERFAREAQTLACLSHPNIVTVFDYGETDGLYYIVMEFVDGVNLRDLLREGTLEPQQALSIVPPVCEALQYAHDKGIVHRDIKPENLLLDRDGRIKIADFGIASLVGASGERSGTPPYMAPEQGATSNEIDHRADIYALGAVLYESLTGERPGSPLKPPSQKVQIDIRIDDIVLRALNKEPERRYRTADEFRTMVETVASTPAPPAVPSGPATPDSPPPAPSAGKPLDPRWTRIPAILMMLHGTANIVLTVLPVFIHPLMKMVTGPGHLFPGGLPFGGVVRDGPSWAHLSSVTFPVSSLAISVLAILGGLHMLRGSSRNWAITGTVACFVTNLWWPLGLAIGILSVVVLLRVKGTVPAAAMSGSTSGVVPANAPDTSPSLCGMAATGAVLQALPIVPLLLFGFLSLVLGAIRVVGPGLLAILVFWMLFAVTGCILGWIAAARIGASQGQLRGMVFAVFAAMTPVILLSSVMLLSSGAALHGLLRDTLYADELTEILIGCVVTLTALALLGAILDSCFRHLRGISTPPRQKHRRDVALTLLVLWLALGGLLWLQRPRSVDSGLQSYSTDNQYLASGSTWHHMRVFGGDVLTYRFNLVGKRGTVIKNREIPIPRSLLAEDHLVAPNKAYHFGEKGDIRWHLQDSSVEFCIGDLSLHTIKL